MDRLEHLGDLLHLGLGNDAEYIPVEVDDTALVFGVRKTMSFSLFKFAQLIVPYQRPRRLF